MILCRYLVIIFTALMQSIRVVLCALPNILNTIFLQPPFTSRRPDSFTISSPPLHTLVSCLMSTSSSHWQLRKFNYLHYYDAFRAYRKWHLFIKNFERVVRWAYMLIIPVASLSLITYFTAILFHDSLCCYVDICTFDYSYFCLERLVICCNYYRKRESLL